MLIYTIGHSTRSLEEFAGLLTLNQIELLVDVRSYPGSRLNPQFNKETLPKSLKQFGIGYEHIPELGGRRGNQFSEEPSPNTAWEVAAFRNYADYALTDQFENGYAKLIALAKKQRAAIMCSEAVWWRCHRRIITDYLLARGVKVFHILSEAEPKEAEMTAFAEVSDAGKKNARKVFYPGEQYQMKLSTSPQP